MKLLKNIAKLAAISVRDNLLQLQFQTISLDIRVGKKEVVDRINDTIHTLNQLIIKLS